MEKSRLTSPKGQRETGKIRHEISNYADEVGGSDPVPDNQHYKSHASVPTRPSVETKGPPKSFEEYPAGETDPRCFSLQGSARLNIRIQHPGWEATDREHHTFRWRSAPRPP